jgi:hypothetical protein
MLNLGLQIYHLDLGLGLGLLHGLKIDTKLGFGVKTHDKKNNVEEVKLLER